MLGQISALTQLEGPWCICHYLRSWNFLGTSVFMCVHVSAYASQGCVWVGTHEYEYMHAYILMHKLYVHIYVCTCMCTVFVCMWIHFAYSSVSMNICGYECISGHVCMWACAYVHISMYVLGTCEIICVYEYAYKILCLCVYTCIFIGVLMYLSMRTCGSVFPGIF